FALVLLWRRGFLRVSPCPAWWGIGFFVVGATLRLAGAWGYADWLQAFSLLVCLAGAAVLYGGGPALRAAWPAVAFLLFMIPLPYRLETALCQPLQSLMSEAGALVLQTLGRPAVA